MSVIPGEKYGKLTVVELVTDGNTNTEHLPERYDKGMEQEG